MDVHAHSAGSQLLDVVSELETQLRILDSLKAPVPAAHLDAAICHLRLHMAQANPASSTNGLH